MIKETAAMVGRIAKRWIPLFVTAAVFAVAAFVVMRVNRREPFGTSPGTMVQLATSHVPTEEDVDFYENVYPRMVRKEVAGLTGEDPGPLRPWAFPLFNAGTTLVIGR